MVGSSVYRKKKQVSNSWYCCILDTPNRVAENIHWCFRTWEGKNGVGSSTSIWQLFYRSTKLYPRSTRCHYQHPFLGANPSLRQMTRLQSSLPSVISNYRVQASISLLINFGEPVVTGAFLSLWSKKPKNGVNRKICPWRQFCFIFNIKVSYHQPKITERLSPPTETILGSTINQPLAGAYFMKLWNVIVIFFFLKKSVLTVQNSLVKARRKLENYSSLIF